jgi:hypothetical protein
MTLATPAVFQICRILGPKLFSSVCVSGKKVPQALLLTTDKIRLQGDDDSERCVTGPKVAGRLGQ